MPDRQIVQTGIVTEDFGSTITSVNHVDTYQCFPLGDTECPDQPVELDQVASELANRGVVRDGLGWDELSADVDDAVLDEWTDRGPYGRHTGKPDLWTVDYDHEGWTRELAEASVAVLHETVVDPEGIIRAVKFTGEVWSPREYNFTTDGYMATWTVDTDALEAWLTENGVTIGNGHGISGFLRTADDETWYLGRALAEYLEHEIGTDYVMLMHEHLTGNGVEHEYVDVQITEAGEAWCRDYVAARAAEEAALTAEVNRDLGDK